MTIDKNKQILKKAIEEYVSYKWKIIPVKYRTKRPILENWTSDYFSTSEQFLQYTSGGNSNVGIVCGKPSGIVVIDIDIDKKTGYNGEQSIREKEMELRCKLPDTVVSQTQGGGKQLWFKYPRKVKNITSTVNKLKSVDVRADGSQVVVYPSVGEVGKYHWLSAPSMVEMAELPQAWVTFLANEQTETSGKIKLAIKTSFELPASIPESSRNTTLHKYACSLFSKGKTLEEVEEELSEVNEQYCTVPIGSKELGVIISSAKKYNARDKERKAEALVQIGGEKTNSEPEELDWIILTEKGSLIIDEPKFAEWFIKKEKLYYINGMFYTENGYMGDDEISHKIQDIIKTYVKINLAAKVKTLLNASKNTAFFPNIKPRNNVLHLKNISLQVDSDGTLTEVEKSFTFNKIQVMYQPYEDCPLWKDYLDGLFYPEDLPLIQEMFGYFFIPTTRAQKSLIVLGSGGEGKSGLFYTAQKLYSRSMYSGELEKIETNQFYVSNLQNKLLFMDDDINMNALDSTGMFKKLVTANGSISVERKGVQHYEIEPYCRFFCLGNGTLQAKYDKSDGFYDRLIFVRVKPIKRRGSSGEDSSLYNKFENELSGIVNWALQGLSRLVTNNYHFSISARSKGIMEETRNIANNIGNFLDDKDWIVYDKNSNVSSIELRDAYVAWCEANNEKPLADRTFKNYLNEQKEQMGIKESKNIKRGNSRVRGFTNIGILQYTSPPKEKPIRVRAVTEDDI